MFGHLGGPEQGGLGQPAAEVEHPNRDGIVGHHLQQVAVSADDHDRVVAFLRRQGAQHVVGLETLRARRRNPEGVQELHDHVDLRGQVVGHFLDVGLARRLRLGHPVRLVRRDEVHPELRSPIQVEADGQPGGSLLGDHHGHRVDESAHGVDRPAVGSGDRRRHPEVRAEPHAGAVEQQQTGAGMPAIGLTPAARRRTARLAWLPWILDRFDAAVYARRLAAAAAATADAGLAGLVITPGYDLRYLVGSRAQTFERLTALVVPASGDPTVVVPRLELASLNGVGRRGTGPGGA